MSLGPLTVIGGGDYDGDLEDAANKKDAGYTAFKIKVGIDSAEKDAARTRDICKLLGPGFLISSDANQGFDTDEACIYARAVQGWLARPSTASIASGPG